MNWNKSFFNLLYQEAFMSRSKEDIEFCVKLIRGVTSINQGSIVDFCCGVGDILSEFETCGFETYGVDFSQEYIKKAKKIYNQKNVFEADALNIDFNKKFDLAINWYSSFGYFDDEKNQLLLNNIFKHIKPGGKFVLEIYNSYDIIRNFKEKLSYEKEYNGSMVSVVRDSIYILNEKKLIQDWSFNYNGELFKYRTENKIYFIDEIIQKMKIAGFKNINVYNKDTKLIEFHPASLNSVRLIFVGEV